MSALKSLTQSTIRNPNAAFLSLCLAGMDACWVFCVAWLFSQVVLAGLINFPVPPMPVLTLLELGGLGLMTYLLDRTTLPIGVVRALLGGVGLVLSTAIALTLSPFNAATYSIVWILLLLFVGLISLGLWLLGGYRATERITYEGVYSNFRLGLIAISAAALLSTLLATKHINQLWTDLGGVGLWYFVFGLAGLALSNREAVRRETGNMGMRSWGWMVTASVIVVLLLGSLGQAFGGKSVLDTLQGIVLGVLQVIAFLIYGVVYILVWLFSLLNLRIDPTTQQHTPTPTPSPAQGYNLVKKAQQEWSTIDLSKMPEGMQTIFMTVAAILVVAAALYFMTRWLRRTRPDRLENEEEERVGFGSWQLLLAQLRAWINRLLSRFRKPVPPVATAEEDELAALQGRPEMAGTLTVRQIYARLLKLASSAGYPRASDQTPIEYQRFLSTALPDLRSDLSDITVAYLEARYGPLPISLLDVEFATAAWLRAEPLLREVKRET